MDRNAVLDKVKVDLSHLDGVPLSGVIVPEVNLDAVMPESESGQHPDHLVGTRADRHQIYVNAQTADEQQVPSALLQRKPLQIIAQQDSIERDSAMVTGVEDQNLTMPEKILSQIKSVSSPQEAESLSTKTDLINSQSETMSQSLILEPKPAEVATIPAIEVNRTQQQQVSTKIANDSSADTDPTNALTGMSLFGERKALKLAQVQQENLAA